LHLFIFLNPQKGGDVMPVIIVYLSWKLVLAAGAVGLATGWSINEWMKPTPKKEKE
jgi:hypothetical protein